MWSDYKREASNGRASPSSSCTQHDAQGGGCQLTISGAFMTMVLCPELVVLGVVRVLCGLLRLVTEARVCSASESRCLATVCGAETCSCCC
jgi:hypothetical protein